MKSTKNKHLLGLFTAALSLLAGAARADDALDSAMFKNPDLPDAKEVVVFPPRLKPLLLEALARPDLDTQCKAALSIAQAYVRGMKDMETAVPALTQLLEKPNQARLVVLAVVRALVALDARQTASQLFALAQSGDNDVCLVVEPALAHWDYRPARALWLERIKQPKYEHPRALLAMRLLAETKDEESVPRLREISLATDAPAPNRIAAARALGKIRTTGLERDAKAVGSSTVDGLVAAELLRHHAGAEAIALLQELAKNEEPAVSVMAVTRLFEIDPKLLPPLVPHLLASYDPASRALAIDVLARFPSRENVRLLVERLDDLNPELRAKSRRVLHAFAAKAEFHGAVIEDAGRMLQAKNWHAQEQAAILLGQLDHKPAARRLLQLLLSERPEVMVASAWGLRKLTVPETLPAVFQLVSERYELMVANSAVGNLTWDDIDPQLSQLVQFLGERKYEPADAFLRRLIPPLLGLQKSNPPGPHTRAAAIWALGMIHESRPDPELVRLFIDRLRSQDPASRDVPQVRWMAAVSLGRMKARDALPVLREFSNVSKPGKPAVSGSNGATWAISQITGEPMPPPGEVDFTVTRWFLSPGD
jgi:HEAT repeat protein